jgi:hypothetical protein
VRSHRCSEVQGRLSLECQLSPEATTRSSQARGSIRHPTSHAVAVPLRAVWVTASGGIDSAVMLATDPLLAVPGLIAYASSTTLTAVERLTVIELTSHLSTWTTTEIGENPSLCATKVAAAFGHREIVRGTAVFTGSLTVQTIPLA